MAKPNYSFDKRQRELKKAKEQEAKRLKKQAQQTADANPASSDDAAESPAKDR